MAMATCQSPGITYKHSTTRMSTLHRQTSLLHSLAVSSKNSKTTRCVIPSTAEPLSVYFEIRSLHSLCHPRIEF